jgi:hypothetical protein
MGYMDRKHPLMGTDTREGKPLNDRTYKRMVGKLVEEECHGS